MGMKGSKPKDPAPSAQERALADVSLDLYGDYKGRYSGLEDELIKAADRDRTPRIQGRSNVDTQRALEADNLAAVSRGTTSGGLGSGASLAAFDEGDVGSALATANQEGLVAGKGDQVNRMLAAQGAVQSGEDISFGGIRSAADVANANVINSFQDKQGRKLANAALLEDVVSNATTGFMKGQQYDQNRKTLANLQQMRSDAAAQKTAQIVDPYFTGPMQLAQTPRAGLPAYSPNGGISFIGYNPSARMPMPLGFGVRRG